MPGLKLNKRLERIVAQIRFRPSLSSWQNTIFAAQLLEGKYKEWKLNKQGDIFLYSPDEQKILRVSSNSLIYSNDMVADTSECIKHIDMIATKVIKDSSVKELSHVGFRNIMIIGTNFGFSELANLIYEKFYQGGEVSKISSDKIKDTVFVLDGEKNNISNHIKIGPVKMDEALANFNPLFDIDKNVLVDDSYVYIDIDTYKKGVITETDNVKSLLEDFISENRRISSEYLSYIEKINDK